MANEPTAVHYNQNLQPLEELLAGVKRPGNFFVEGKVEVPMPRVEIEGVGVLSFPVPESQTVELLRHAVLAPYGKGGKTLVDTSVRKVWQIPPDKVRLGGKSWAASFGDILATVIEGLGCQQAAVSAELYKLLLYDKGGFFLPHRDTEKADGMFGTLVVVLPSLHRGGELIVRHGGRESRVDMSSAEVSEISFAAFYADCEHEVKPITEGNRVCLVYNLIQKRALPGTGSALLQVPDNQTEILAAAAILEDALAADGSLIKLGWLLEHQYSPDGLSFPALKNADSARAKVLVAAALRAGCEAHLGIVHIEESGPAEIHYDQSRGRRRGWGGYRYEEEERDADDEDYEIVEISDSRQFIDQWVDVKDQRAALGEIPLEKGELLPAGALDQEPPDEQRLTEATGNEGASFERSYHRAAIILWNRDRHVKVLLQSGIGAALAYLRERARACAAEPAGKAVRAKVLEEAKSISNSWADDAGFRSYGRKMPGREEMLELLRILGAMSLLEEFISQVVMRDYDGSENAALLACTHELGAPKTGALLPALASHNMARFPPRSWNSSRI